MNIPLDRLIEGIVATMRSDVIPQIADPYARGQAVGVIDLLNNIAPRVEWARTPIETLIDAKIGLLDEVRTLVPELGAPSVEWPVGGSTEDLVALKAGLDAAIGDAIAAIWPRRTESGCDRAAALLATHLHDEMAAEMKITRKPLFAEIASGAGGG